MLLLIYNSLIQAHFDYCDIYTVWHSDLNQEQSEQHKLQNRAVWVITQAGYEVTCTVDHPIYQLNLDGIIYILAEYTIQP